MKASFTAYIDEAGDEGFKFLPDEKGSSRWFVLSATIFRSSNALAPVAAIKEVRSALQVDPKKPIHFRDLKHEKRVVCTSIIAKQAFRTVTIASYKPDIDEPEHYKNNKDMLYRYLTRLLLERASWLCRDSVKENDGDGTIDLVFSDRAAMSYEDMRVYVRHLRAQQDGSVRIHWPAINIDSIRAVQHAKLAGLQVADAVASSMFFALHLNPYGFSEPRYAQILRGHTYRHKGARLGYGLKFLSNFESLKNRMPHVGAAFEDW